jgi:hypothetical protein
MVLQLIVVFGRLVSLPRARLAGLIEYQAGVRRRRRSATWQVDLRNSGGSVVCPIICMRYRGRPQQQFQQPRRLPPPSNCKPTARRSAQRDER